MEEGEIVDSEDDVSDVFRFVKPSPPTLMLPRKTWAQQAPRRHPADVRNHIDFAQRENNNMHNHLYQNHYPNQRLHPMDRQYPEFGLPHRSEQNNHYSSLHSHLSHSSHPHPDHLSHPSHMSHFSHPPARPLHPHPHLDPHSHYEPVRRVYADPFPPRVEVKSAYNAYSDPRSPYPDPYLRSDTKQHYSHFDHYPDHSYDSFPQRRLESKNNNHYPDQQYSEFSRDSSMREPQRIDSRYELAQSRPENAPSHYTSHSERYSERPPLDSMYTEFSQRTSHPFPAERRAPFGEHDRHGAFLEPADRFLDRPSERFLDHERSLHPAPDSSERPHPSFSAPPDRLYPFPPQPERAHSAFVTTCIDRPHTFLPPIHDRSHASPALVDRSHSSSHTVFQDVRNNASYLDHSSPHAFASPVPERSPSFPAPLDRTSSFPAPLDRTSSFPAPLDRTPSFPAPNDRTSSFSTPLDRPSPFPVPLDRPSPFPSPLDRPSPFLAPLDRTSPFPAPIDRPSPFLAPLDRPSPFPAPIDRTPSFSAPLDRPSPFPAPLDRPSLSSSAEHSSQFLTSPPERSLSSEQPCVSSNSNERSRLPQDSPLTEPTNGHSLEAQSVGSIPQRVQPDFTDSAQSRGVRTPSTPSSLRPDESQNILANSPPLLTPYPTKKLSLGLVESAFKPRKFARSDPGPPLLTPPSAAFSMDVRTQLVDRSITIPMSDRIVPRPMTIQTLNRGHWIPGKARELGLNDDLSKPEMTMRDELDLRYHKQILAFAELQQQALLLEIKEIAIDRELSRIRGKTVLLSQSL